MNPEQEIQAIESDLSILLKSLTNVGTTAAAGAKEDLASLDKDIDALENKIAADMTELLHEEEKEWDSLIAEEEAEKTSEKE